MSRDQLFPESCTGEEEKRFPFSLCLKMHSEEALFASSTFYAGAGFRGTEGGALGFSQ